MENLPDPERWRRLDALFAAALDRSPAERSSYLLHATDGDEGLYRDACALLERAADAERVLGESALELARPMLASLADPLDPGETAMLGGTRIGPYRIVDEIGRGGMGVVYRARDVRLDRIVALKFLPPDLSTDEPAKRRFVTEARAVSATEHPNVGSIYEIGETDDGRTYLVLAWYEGETLKDRIARGPVPCEEALELARQIAAGLAAAHARAIVHRDIKPGNVIITRDGWIKILDFGIAKMAGGDAAGRGDRLGTTSYMSPEQIRGDEVDGRTDVWSLGVVIHEMLTGQPPFRGDRDDAVIHAILHDAPAPLDSSGIPVTPALQPVLDRALAKDPAERYATAEELLRGIESARAVVEPESPRVQRSPVPDQSTGRRWRRRIGMPLALSLAVLAAAWGVFRDARTTAAGPGVVSLAVLPFSDLGDESDDTYFSDGITEDILMALSGIAALRVVSSTSAMHYKDSDKRVREIADELGVGHIVEGSVRRAGDRVRISARLIEADTDRRLWSETYDRDLTDIFRIQSDIAQRIAGELQARLSPQEQHRLEVPPTDDIAAYDLLLQATDFVRRYRRGDNEVGIGLLQQAIAADSSFALAYARLGTALALKVFQYGDSYEWADSAHEAALRAVDLDIDLAEAHHALGLAHLAWERYDDALEAVGRATELNSGYWAALNVAGVVRWRRGEQDEALRWYRRALALDPVGHASSLSTIAGSYALLGLFDESRTAVDRALALRPDLPLAYLNAVLLALVQGDDTGAAAQARMLLTTSPGNARAWATAGTASQFAGDLTEALTNFGRAYEISPTSFDLMRRQTPILLAHTLWTAGEINRARTLLDEFLPFARAQIDGGNHGPFLRYNLAAAHTMLGDRDEAFRWLEAAVATGWTDHLLLARDPLFHDLHADERFERILERNRAEMDRQRERVRRENL